MIKRLCSGNYAKRARSKYTHCYDTPTAYHGKNLRVLTAVAMFLLVLFIFIIIIAFIKAMKASPKQVGDTSLLLLITGIMFGLWFKR